SLIHHFLHADLAQTHSRLPEPAEPPRAQEVFHCGYHQRVIIRAHHGLYRGDQVIQGGRKARRRLSPLHALCPCRHLGTFYHGSHGVSSSRVSTPLQEQLYYPAPWSCLAGGVALRYPRLQASPCSSGCVLPTP